MAICTLARRASSLLSSAERALRICCRFMLRCYQNPQRLTSFVQRRRGRFVRKGALTVGAGLVNFPR
jgi:hypothetical protein